MRTKMPNTLNVSLRHPCGRMVARDGWGRSRANSVDLRDHELWLVWQGAGWMETGSGRIELRPGFLAWMRPGGIYDAGLYPHRTLGFTYLHFTCNLADPPEFFHLADVAYFDAATRRVVELVEPTGRARRGARVDAPAAAEAILTALLLDLLHRPARVTAAEFPVHHDAIAAFAAELRESPERPIDVAAMAARLGVTPAHFSRLFRAQRGLSPQQLHRRARIDRARHLLAESDLSVTQIADALGYADLFHFSKRFTHHVGMNPTAYRRSLRTPTSARPSPR